MAHDIPKTVKQWNVVGNGSFDCLKFSEQPVPEIGDTQVLVKLRAAALNYRDITIANGTYLLPVKDGVVAGSDGAGIVLAVGKNVSRFKAGDHVVTMFNQAHIGGPLDLLGLGSGLGGLVDGTLRTVGAFDQQGLVLMPKSLSFAEASALTCAGLTAWNALHGMPGKEVTAGQHVLTQGTGGVSIFALQLAKAAGAKVIATTSSPEKAKLLEKLGADHIINYKETPEWSAKVKELTGGLGVDHVIEVAVPTSTAQCIASVKIGGLVSIIGYLSGQQTEEPSFLAVLTGMCTLRSFLVGSRVQMEELCRAIEANPEKLRPVLDSKKFKLEHLKEAYEYMAAGKHQGKVVIEID